MYVDASAPIVSKDTTGLVVTPIDARRESVEQTAPMIVIRKDRAVFPRPFSVRFNFRARIAASAPPAFDVLSEHSSFPTTSATDDRMYPRRSSRLLFVQLVPDNSELPESIADRKRELDSRRSFHSTQEFFESTP